MFALYKLSTTRVNPRLVVARALATSSTTQLCTLPELCRANSEVLSRVVSVIDSLIEKTHDIESANKIFQTESLGTTVGRQVRHSLDHLEKVALDGLRTVRDHDKPIDLHYDVRDRGTFCEKDVCEARHRALFIQNIFDGVCADCDKEGAEVCSADGARSLTAYFTLPGTASPNEIPLHSTLEREMGFVCHHAVHHNTLIKAIAALGETGLTLDDLPEDFGRPPTYLVRDVESA